MSPGYRLRPSTGDDVEFLVQVYASTRVDELAPLGWSESQFDAFVRAQFVAQDVDYRRRRPAAEFLVIEHEGAAVGRLYVDRSTDPLHVLDLAILPGFRGRGLGGRILADLMAEAGAAGRALTIYVEDGNPAHSLYRRLGFEPVERIGIHQLLRVTPAT